MPEDNLESENIYINANSSSPVVKNSLLAELDIHLKPEQISILQRLKRVDVRIADSYYSIHWCLNNKFPPDWSAYVSVSARDILKRLLLAIGYEIDESNKSYLKSLHYIQSCNPDVKCGDSIEIEKRNKKQAEFHFLLRKQDENITMERAYLLTKLWSEAVKVFNSETHHGLRTNDDLLKNELTRQIEKLDYLLYELFVNNDYLQKTDAIDKILQQKTVDQATLDRLIIFLSQRSLEVYFYEKCTDPKWFDLIIGAGLETPPEKIINENGIIYPNWPFLDYTKKIAKNDPVKIMNWIIDLPKISNPVVAEQILNISLLMPSEIASKIIIKLKRDDWIALKGGAVIQMTIAELLKMMINADDISSSLELALVLLCFEMPVKSIDEEGLFYFDNHVSSIYDNWVFEYIMQNQFKLLCHKAPRESFIILIKCLYAALRKECGNSSDIAKKSDFSHIWRNEIRKPENHNRSDYKHEVINALVNIIDKMLGMDDILFELNETIDDEAIKYSLLKRLKIYITGATNDTNKKFEILVNAVFLECKECQNELKEILVNNFKIFDLTQKNIVLRMLGLPGSLDDLKDDEVPKMYLLQSIQDYLSQDQKNIYNKLVEKFGEPQPNFGIMTSWSGPESPCSSSDLESMSDEQLCSYLIEYEPEGASGFGPSCDGLGECIKNLVVLCPEKYLFLMEAIVTRKIPAVYIYNFLSALDNIIILPDFDWDRFLKLCLYLTDEKNWDSHPAKMSEYSVSWKSVQRKIADIFQSALMVDDVRIPIEVKEDVWIILSRLVDYPDPDTADDGSLNGDDPYLVMINTTRGTALNALISYGLWIAKSMENYKDANKRMDPRLRTLLNKKLDTKNETSPSVRFVFGQRIANLSYLDKEWLYSVKNQIFPSEKEQKLYWLAAFQGFLIHSQVYLPLVVWLGDLYATAIEYATELDVSNSKNNNLLIRFFPQHIMIAYAHGALSFEIIKDFFSSVDVKLREDAISFTSRALLINDEILDSDGKERLLRLWEFLVNDTNQASQIFGHFAGWYTAPALQHDAKLVLLEKTLAKTIGCIEDAENVIHSFMTEKNNNPLLVAKLTSLILKNDKSRWLITIKSDLIKDLLESLINLKQQEITDVVKDLLNDFYKRGYWNQYQDLKKLIYCPPIAQN
ncbi:MAG TPA: hypothetical protein PLF71_00430 [bacterium]|nr:MAG: hypothetical protein BWY14_00431 [Parcubacteria group bacterium ADurb.Bin192]HPN14573.1 hypothetical protein [bacterium]